MDISSLLGPDSGDAFTVRTNMVSTLTGSATMNHVSEDMGNDTDGQLFAALRNWAEVVLVGAQTVRAEDYSGVKPNGDGSRPAPIAVPSRSLEFDVTSDFFTGFTTPPIILVPHSSRDDQELAKRIATIESTGAEVCDAGEGTVQDYISVLKDRGFKRVLCEGGPGMIGQLVDIDAIDQMYLTLDPHLSTGVETPMATFRGEHSHRRMQLENVAADQDGTVFLRYSRAR
ncbi:pyrimidine reductase family protein [Corynebacterium sp. MSK158]|uniref:pyrimidine reductase family protein n=1 Tax=Corynebacterium sp. MSK158 TaxID=3050212 RepID=UPI00255020FA|nr:pyrimidine reductase family protein [Corynebacterium sp. MSK158]MDK8693032.1 pyrimidine reductase family protein [Corynebacterium sp. MSK158]